MTVTITPVMAWADRTKAWASDRKTVCWKIVDQHGNWIALSITGHEDEPVIRASIPKHDPCPIDHGFMDVSLYSSTREHVHCFFHRSRHEDGRLTVVELSGGGMTVRFVSPYKKPFSQPLLDWFERVESWTIPAISDPVEHAVEDNTP